MSNYHWQTVMHINAGDHFVRIDRCMELGFCRQTTTQRKGYDPVYTLQEAIAEAEYRQSLREESLVTTGGGSAA